MRRVATTGQEASAPTSEEYANIPASHVGFVASFHAMFARQGYGRGLGAANVPEIAADETDSSSVIACYRLSQNCSARSISSEIADSEDGWIRNLSRTRSATARGRTKRLFGTGFFRSGFGV